MVLVGCEGWAAAGGPQTTHFSPLINYNHAGDVYYIEHPQVKDGKLYYLSFGPGQFVVPYYTGKLLNIPYTPLLLQVINLLVHLLCGWLLYRIVLLLSGNKNDRAAKWAVLFFFFSAETLWFFGNGYVHESMVMPFFLAGIYYALKIFAGQEMGNSRNTFMLGLVIFAGVFFDWLMLFFAAGVSLMAMYGMLRKKEKQWAIFLVSAIAGLAALGGIIWLYSSYYGAERFWNLLLNKYGNRNGFAGDTSVSGTTMIISLAKHFATGYLPLLLLLTGGLFVFLRKRKDIPAPMKIFLLLNIPALVYFLAFVSFSAEHDYSVLKFSVLISVLSGFALNSFFVKKNSQLAAAFIIVALNAALYYYINPPGKKGFNGDDYAIEQRAGLLIKTHAQPDELVTHNMRNANWLAVYYYSKRNSLYMPDADSARRFFEGTPAGKMVFVDVVGDTAVHYHK